MRTAMKMSVCVCLVALVVAPVQADPLPGRDVLKFQQLPMDATSVDGALYWGHDEASQIYGDHATGLYNHSPAAPAVFMADDFADTKDTAVVHVKWWGSYGQNYRAIDGAQRFLISFETDVPADPLIPTSFSYPGTPLLNQVVDKGALSPASGTFTETLISAGGPPLSEDLYEYNAELKIPFNQQADTVYWLKIVALIDPIADAAPGQLPFRWGWHNRDYTVKDTLTSPVPVPGEYLDGYTAGGTEIWHFQDDAISGTLDSVVIDPSTGAVAIDQLHPSFVPQNYKAFSDGPLEIQYHSKDLAFELYTVPEPGTAVMLATAGLVLARRRKRCRD